MRPGMVFDEPVIVPMSKAPVRTVEQALQIVTSRLQGQFTVHRLSTLLVLERAAEGLEVAEAREAFRVWAYQEFTALDACNSDPRRECVSDS